MYVGDYWRNLNERWGRKQTHKTGTLPFSPLGDGDPAALYIHDSPRPAPSDPTTIYHHFRNIDLCSKLDMDWWRRLKTVCGPEVFPFPKEGSQTINAPGGASCGLETKLERQTPGNEWP